MSFRAQFKLEEKALKELVDLFKDLGENAHDLWKEFEECKTNEAKYVHTLDKIEAITHLLSVKDFSDLDYTITYADKAVMEFPELKLLLKEVKQRLRKECEEVGEEWKSEYDLV